MERSFTFGKRAYSRDGRKCLLFIGCDVPIRGRPAVRRYLPADMANAWS